MRGIKDELTLYRGISMGPTFHEGDLLRIVQVNFTSIESGDVIAFCSAQHSYTMIAHRVYVCKQDVLYTQGDALRVPDREPVTAGALLGRVEYVERQGKVYPVLGGWQGRLWVTGLYLMRMFVNLFRRPYLGLRASGLVQRCAVPLVSQVALSTPEGPRIKYLFLGRSVATWQPAQGRFTCRKPFDLFIKPPG